jgi:starch phosphorylase
MWMENSCFRVKWIPGNVVRGMAYDTPIPGYKADTARLLRPLS